MAQAQHLAPSLAILATLLSPAIGTAQTPGNEDLARQLREQNERIQKLESARGETDTTNTSGIFVGYDKGYVIRSTRSDDPFELKINGRMQFRYSAFAPNRGTYSNLQTRASGTPIQDMPRSDFEIERGRLEFSGTFYSENLHFYINLDADTDDNHRTIFHDFWVNYDISDDTSIYIGKAFVPGSREWLGGSTRTHLADRSLASTFFRPDRSVGIWVIGEAAEDLHYRAMVGNGYNTTDLNRNSVNRDFAFSLSSWYEPNGKFGKGYADIKSEPNVRTRFGFSASYAEESGTTASGAPLAESTVLRLDDGSRLTALGVTNYNMYVAAVDAAIKVGGISLHGEGYYRWLQDIRPVGGLPTMFPFRSNKAFGGYITAGCMIMPERLELVATASSIQGDFKDSHEYGLGFNYYVEGNHKNKLSIDAIYMDGAPVSNSGPNYRVGDDGIMARIQYQIAF